jgi:cobalt-zinc-cadmium efflux system membrane fusion protein
VKEIPMETQTNRNKLIAGAAIAAIVLGGGGVMLGRTAFAPTAATMPTETGEPGKEEGHGPEGFVVMDAARAQAAGIVTETVQSGGLGAEILAQGVVAATPEGEAVLTARADGAVVRILVRLGDNVQAGQTVALIESREAATLASDRSAAAARVTAARAAYVRELKLFKAGVTARQDLEAAEAVLAEAESELRRATNSASASKLSGDGRTLAIVSPISGRVSKTDAKLGAYVLAGAELFRVSNQNRLQINASVLAADARRIQPGDTAVVELLGGETMTAVVRSTTPSLDPESKLATIVLQPQGIAGLTQGQGLRVRIKPRAAPMSIAIALPEEAVQSFEGRDVVFVRTAKGFQATNVVTGKRGGGRIEIVDGLKPGDIVATKGAFLLKAELGKGEAEH